MAKREVWKFPIAPIVGVCPIAMPKGAEILHVAAQENKPVLWALVDPEAEKEDRMVIGWITGAPIEVHGPYAHLGTVLLDGGSFVSHVLPMEADRA